MCTSRFLAHLHIHPYARLTISANIQDGEEVGAQSMAPMLPENPAVTFEPLATVDALQMVMSSGDNSPKISTCTGPGVLPNVHLRMELRPRDPVNPYASARWGSVSSLTGLLGRSPLTSLSVAEVHPDTVSSWATVFRTFHLLERLTVRGGWGPRCAVGIKNAFLGLHAVSTADPDSPIACPNLAHVSVHAVVEITAVYQAMRTCFRFRGDRRVVLAELELDFAIPKSSTTLYRACVKDIVDCVERLSLRGVRMYESGEAEPESGRNWTGW